MVMDTVSPQVYTWLEENNMQYRVFPNMQSEAAYDLATIYNGSQTFINYQDYFQIMMMNKFYMYELTDYDKVCYFDGDIVIRKNVDFVFNFSAPAGKILSRGDIVFACDEETGTSGPLISPPFIAGENLLIEPKSYKFDDIREQFTAFGFDEEVIRSIYPRHKITDLRLSDWDSYVFHAHAHCSRCRYWDVLHIHTLEDMDILCRDIIDNDIQVYTELKQLSGEEECRAEIDKFERDAHVVDITLPEDERYMLKQYALDCLANQHYNTSEKIAQNFDKKK